MARARRTFTPEFKRDAVGLFVKESKTVSEVARQVPLSPGPSSGRPAAVGCCAPACRLLERYAESSSSHREMIGGAFSDRDQSSSRSRNLTHSGHTVMVDGLQHENSSPQR